MQRGGAVLYARDMDRLAAFYAAVLGMPERGRDEEHVLLDSATFELVIRQMPGPPSAVPVAPPRRRADAAVKLVYFVPSLATVRTAVARHGGVMDAAPKEWLFNGLSVWDALDPEGNVIQFRGPAT